MLSKDVPIQAWTFHMKQRFKQLLGVDGALAGTEKGLKGFEICFDGPCAGIILTQCSYMLVTYPRESLIQA